jgi:LmbE family N-acetylglucosaminyl deacetylase
METILVIGAHPDDIEIGCGGTLLRLLSEHEVDVHWFVLSGNQERKQEALTSATRFLDGARSHQIAVEDFRDAFFPASYTEIKERFLALREEVDPDVIFTHRCEDRHQDHRLVAELTWNTFRDQLILEYEIPKYEGDLGRPNIYVPIEKKHCEAKVATIVESYESQSSKKWFCAETFWALMRLRAIEANSETRFAEAFHCRKLVL